MLLVAVSIVVAIVAYSYISAQVIATSRTAGVKINIDYVDFKNVNMYMLNGSSTYRVRWYGGITTTTIIVPLTNTSYPYTKALSVTAKVETTTVSRMYTTSVISTATVNTITFTSLPLTIHVKVRNTGSTAAVIHTIMVTTGDGKIVYKGVLEEGNVVRPKRAITFVFNDAAGEFNWSPNSLYKVRVVTDTGFIAEATFVSPI